MPVGSFLFVTFYYGNYQLWDGASHIQVRLCLVNPLQKHNQRHTPDMPLPMF